MKHSGNNKSGNERFLPKILQFGILFKELARSSEKLHQQYSSIHRRRIYSMMNNMLADEDKATWKTYWNWFHNPEKRVNGSYLEGIRANVAKWDRIVPVMEFVITQVAQDALNEAREAQKFYTDLDESLSEILQINVLNLPNTETNA